MKTDNRFCMNSYLMYRTLVDHDKCLDTQQEPWYFKGMEERKPVNTAEELDAYLREQMKQIVGKGPVALMLSGGMDSAILARYLPEGTQTYTLRCEAQSGIDETEAAAKYAALNHLKHDIVHVYWEDFEKYSLGLMQKKGYPIHSIEVQIYKAAMQAKQDGIQTLIFGETADIIYGGHSKLLARDWDLEAFTKRFSFVDPHKVLKNPLWIQDPILPYVKEDGNVDVFAFLNGFEYDVSLGFYNNACSMAGMPVATPYASSILGHPLDLQRIRNGEGKYVIRELFMKLYPELPVPQKTPLPRPMEEWLKDWKGPLHEAFREDALQGLTGDQKWYVYALNEFLLKGLRGEECSI